jgi:succinyl-diaminopimelate desuccinylase
MLSSTLMSSNSSSDWNDRRRPRRARFVADHPNHPGTLALLITSDEEGPSIDGTARVVEELKRRGEKIDYCIVGEPSSAQVFGDTIKNAAAAPHHAPVVHGAGTRRLSAARENPVHLAAPALAEMAATEWDRGSSSFRPPRGGCPTSTPAPGRRTSFPARCRSAPVSLLHREHARGLKARVDEILAAKIDCAIDWVQAESPSSQARPPVDTLSSVVKKVSGVTPEVNCTGGTSDGRFIFDICPEVAEFGPVNRSIHKVNEAVALEEIEPLARIYRLAIGELLGAD